MTPAPYLLARGVAHPDEPFATLAALAARVRALGADRARPAMVARGPGRRGGPCAVAQDRAGRPVGYAFGPDALIAADLGALLARRAAA